MVRIIHTGVLLLGAILLVNGLQTAPHSLESYTFEEFVQTFGREYAKDSAEWKTREQVFQQNLREVIKFQSGPARSWTQGVTKFLDQTHAEFRAVLGYTGLGQRKTSPDQWAKYTMKRHKVDIPMNFSALRSDRHLGNLVRDQGACGSCWAVAATSVLEGQMETNENLMQRISTNLKTMYQSDKFPTLSSQTVVSCTENPRNCGGTGGCGGATAELAYDMVKEKGGLPLAEEWPYQSGFGGSESCEQSVFAHAQVKIGGYDVLPSNKYDPLIEALVTTGGPIAVSVDASSWSFYTGGIYRDDRHSEGEFEVNHAVTLCAYQKPSSETERGTGSRFSIASALTGYENGSTDQGMGYWLLKNSWGQSWGESGFIRIEMKSKEEDHCGWDRKTHDGLACDGDPDTAWVCGTCGILYDSVYPTDIKLVGDA